MAKVPPSPSSEVEMHDVILDFIREFHRRNGYAPSYREIRDGVGLSSTSQVSIYINDLVEEGKLAKEDGQSRTIRLV